MNKKADAPTLLIVIIAMLLSSSLLFAFITSNKQLTQTSDSLGSSSVTIELFKEYTEEQSKLILKEAINSCQSCQPTELKEKISEISIERNPEIPNTGNYFGKLRNLEFSLQNSDNKYLLNIENVFVKSQNENAEVTSTFDICMHFDPKGDFLNKC